MSQKTVQKDPLRELSQDREAARKDYARCEGEYRSATGLQVEPKYPTPEEVIAHSKGEREMREAIRP